MTSAAPPEVRPRLRVAEFRGSAERRGAQHGELLGPVVRENRIVEYYNSFCEGLVQARPTAATRAACRALHAAMAWRWSPEAKARLKGFAAAAGFPYGDVARAFAMPDAFNVMAGVGIKLAPVLGCTSIAAWGDYARGGKFLYGRNLDFPGNGFWDRAPLVARHRPDKGIPYVSVSTAGCVLDGITGINEEGVTVALHQHLTTDVGLGRRVRPVLDLSTEILQTARDIEDAVRVFTRWRTSSAWTLVLTHWTERRACVVERAYGRYAVHQYDGGRMVRTNTFKGPALAAVEAGPPAFRESSRLRGERAAALVEVQKGHLDPAILASILSDHLDPDRDRVRAFGQAIAQPHNMTSVVFEPEDGAVWVGDGGAPACDGGFVKVPLWSGKPGEERLDKGESPLSASQARGYGRYLAAFESWNRERDDEKALGHLVRASEADPKEPIYRYLQGLFELKKGEVSAAAATLEAGESVPDLPHRTQAMRLWRARALDVQGRRAEALSLYRSLGAASPRLRKAAQGGLAKPYRLARVAQVPPDFIYGDTYHY